jgi:hypothetical protein
MLDLPLEVLERIVSFCGPKDVPTFQSRNLDTLLALLADWSLARHSLSHVGVWTAGARHLRPSRFV